MYVDESGDVGMQNSPTKFFILTGLVFHELRWRDTLDGLINIKRDLKQKHGLRFYEEFHAGQLLSKPGQLSRIPKHQRFLMIRHFTKELAALPDISVITVVVDKSTKPPSYDAFEMAWKVLMQRFENTIAYRNFPGPQNADDRGMIIADDTDVTKLKALLRKMRKFNNVPSLPHHSTARRNLAIKNLVEDPVFRDSKDSLFVQAADLCAFLAYQAESPNAYIRKQGAQNLFTKLSPILCKVASKTDPLGVVRL